MAGFRHVAGGLLKTTRKGSIFVSMKEIEAWVRRNREKMPRLVRGAKAAAATCCQKQLREVMKAGGGVHGVPAFAPYERISLDIRARRHQSGPMGGALANPRTIVKFTRGGDQYIGWTDKLQPTAIKFQDAVGETPDPFGDSSFRQRLHRAGIAEVPRAYVHNRRDVVNTWGANLRQNLREIRKSVIEKKIAREIEKTRGRAA